MLLVFRLLFFVVNMAAEAKMGQEAAPEYVGLEILRLEDLTHGVARAGRKQYRGQRTNEKSPPLDWKVKLNADLINQ